MVAEDCPLHYHIDPASQNVLLVKVDDLTILIWKLTVNNEMIAIKTRLHWAERDVFNLIWVTVLFAVIMTFLYYCSQITKMKDA